MRVALSIMLMQECCNFICQWENEPGGVPIRIKHLLIPCQHYYQSTYKVEQKPQNTHDLLKTMILKKSGVKKFGYLQLNFHPSIVDTVKY